MKEKSCPFIYAEKCPHTENASGCPFLSMLSEINLPSHCIAAPKSNPNETPTA